MNTFKEYLFELFDKPWKMEHDPDMEEMVRHHFNNDEAYKDHKFGAVKVFKLEGDNGHLIHAIRKGYHELHHIASDNSSGDAPPKLSSPNPKFIGTALHYAKDLIDSDKTIKIVARPDIHKKLKPIIDRIGKHNGYDVNHDFENIGGNEMHTSTIKRTLKENKMFPMFTESHMKSTRLP
jgi:hypothetical protein